MKLLIVHQNCPAQYLHLVTWLAQQGQHELVFITKREKIQIPGVRILHYRSRRKVPATAHQYLRSTEENIINAQEVANVAMNLRTSGFVPDVMLGHTGWGETLFLKDVYPSAPLIGYFEFFYNQIGADVGFDNNKSAQVDQLARLRAKNITNLMAMNGADAGHTPTAWQHSLYPEFYRNRIQVIHEGINTEEVRPNGNASINLSRQGIRLHAGEEILTYVARSLEPYRGFPQFMRSLPEILRQRPKARVVIVGGEGTSYGPPPAGGGTHKQELLNELSGDLDLSRIHFVGRVSYPTLKKIFQVSRVHVYLTVPFVLSWSMLEAMSSGALVIGSRTAPVTEVIQHGENGLLVEFNDRAALIEQIVGALEQPESFLRLRQTAREHIIEKYDLHQKCLPSLLNFIQVTSAMGRH